MSTIQTAGPEAVAAMGAIAEATGLFPANLLPGMIQGALDGSKPDVWLAAREAGRVVGFAFCEPERLTVGTWNLLAIGVEPAHQGAGVGGLLLGELERRLRESGQRVLLVETLGTPEFARTRQFYLRHGFREQARIPDFYEEGGDKVVFWKKLTAGS